jgi:hypothetical protein
MHWRGILRVLHRDLGYLFFGTTIVYAVSGVAINHRNDWNPTYSITRREVSVSAPSGVTLTSSEAKSLLAGAGVKARYLNHYSPGQGQTRIFFQGGNATLEREANKMVIESLEKRPLLGVMVQLHYNPVRAWTWFSDIYSGALIIVAVTGLFLLRGHHGITRRGGLLTALGILVPIIFVIIYL